MSSSTLVTNFSLFLLTSVANPKHICRLRQKHYRTLAILVVHLFTALKKFLNSLKQFSQQIIFKTVPYLPVSRTVIGTLVLSGTYRYSASRFFYLWVSLKKITRLSKNIMKYSLKFHLCDQNSPLQSPC